MVTSGSHIGHAQWYILHYYYCKKKGREPVAHANVITSVTSFPVMAASGSTTCQHPLKCDFVRTDILLTKVNGQVNVHFNSSNDHVGQVS